MLILAMLHSRALFESSGMHYLYRKQMYCKQINFTNFRPLTLKKVSPLHLFRLCYLFFEFPYYFSSALTYRMCDVPASRPRLAKIRGTALPQEYDLERLVAGIPDPHSSWTADTPVCEWDGVICMSRGTPTSLRWSSHASRMKGGTVYLQFMPVSIQTFSVPSCGLFGGSYIRITSSAS